MNDLTHKGAMRKAWLLTTALMVHGCGEDFDPYNLVGGFRVLAIGAEQPQLLPGDTTSVGALAVSPLGDPIDYTWSWCPFTTGSVDGYSCALGRSAFQAQLDALLGDDSFEVPAYNLGTADEAQFENLFPPEAISAFCDALSGQLPDSAATTSVDVPSCSPGLPITLRLEATSGDQTVLSIAAIELLADGATVPNNPPAASGLRIAEGPGASFEDSVPMRQSFDTKAGQEYSIFVDIDADQSEAYEDDEEALEEDLVFSWFFTKGEARFGRTAYLPLSEPVVDLESGRTNRWTAPDEAGPVDFYVVVRDSRDALSWIDARLRVRAP